MFARVSLVPHSTVDKIARPVQSVSMPIALTLLVAESSGPDWPDGIDASLTVFYLTLFFGIPLLGHVMMAIDFRRYLRSLRRALVVVSDVVQVVPFWALMQRPACLRTFGLALPCTEEEVLTAYRERAKEMHPDRGGDLQQFLQLQKHFEEALRLVRGE